MLIQKDKVSKKKKSRKEPKAVKKSKSKVKWFGKKGKAEEELNLQSDATEEERLPSRVLSAETKSEGVDFIAPSLIKETLPTDETAEGVKFNDYYVEIGGTSEQRYFRTFYTEILGGHTVAGMLDPLLVGDFGQGDTDIAIHIEPVDTTDELNDIAKRILQIRSDLYVSMPDETRAKLNDELSDLTSRQRRLRQNIEKPFRASLQVIASSTDIKGLKKFTNNMTRRFSANEIYLRSPDGKQLEALRTITPLADDPFYKEHTYSFETSNIADFFPFGNGKISHNQGVIWGRDHFDRPIFYDAWDKSLMNRNGVVTGSSGAGKTFGVLRLVHHDVLRGIQHVIVCPKGDYQRYIEAMGCPYIDLSVDSHYKINFFDVDVEEVRTNKGEITKKVNLEDTIVAARTIVFRMIKILDENMLGGLVKVRIEKAIRDLYKSVGITEDPSSLYTDEPDTSLDNTGEISFSMKRKMKKMPQIGDLYLKMKGDPSLTEAAELLQNFTQHGDSPTQAIFDCQSNVKLANLPIIGFGLSRLDAEVMRPLGLFISTKWLSTKFAHKNRHIRKRLVVDEAQIPMEDPETAQWLEGEFRIVRFFNTGVWAITQGFEVFTRSEHGLGILKNAPTKLFLKQDSIDITEIQKKFNLTDYEARFLVEKAGQGLGILRINEDRSLIQVDSTANERILFETNPDKIVGVEQVYAK